MWTFSMSRGSSAFFAASMAIAAFAADAAAQEHPAPAGFGFGLSAGYVDFSGDELEAVKGGFGAQATGRYTWENAFQLVLGVQYSRHSNTGSASDTHFLVVFIDPRYVFRLYSSERLAPFFGGRLAYVRQGVSGDGVEGSGAGVLAGITAGFIWELSQRVAIEPSVSFGGVWLKENLLGGGTPQSDDATGSTSTFQLGIAVSFPR
jgi:hypothetical protein